MIHQYALHRLAIGERSKHGLPTSGFGSSILITKMNDRASKDIPLLRDVTGYVGSSHFQNFRQLLILRTMLEPLSTMLEVARPAASTKQPRASTFSGHSGGGDKYARS